MIKKKTRVKSKVKSKKIQLKNKNKNKKRMSSMYNSSRSLIHNDTSLKFKNKFKEITNPEISKLTDYSTEEKSLLDLLKSKNISVTTSVSSIKSKSHISDIYDYKPLHDKINMMCSKKIIDKEPKLNKKTSKQICECLFNKNKDLTITELETRINKKKDTPSSECITILDNYMKTQKKT
jgi:hypothetical protein